MLELGEVDDGVVVDVVGNGRPSEDTTAHDALENEALKVDAPRASKAPRDPAFRYKMELDGLNAKLIPHRLRTARSGFTDMLIGLSTRES